MFADRVKDTTTSTGTGNITLSGTAPTGFVDFNTAHGTNMVFYYAIIGGVEWEVGSGYLSTSTTLVRDRVISSSNSGSVVNFSSGTKDVINTLPAECADNMCIQASIQRASPIMRLFFGV